MKFFIQIPVIKRTELMKFSRIPRNQDVKHLIFKKTIIDIKYKKMILLVMTMIVSLASIFVGIYANFQQSYIIVLISIIPYPLIMIVDFYNRRILVVSHRWKMMGNPDPQGTTIREVLSYDKEYIFIDYCCLPQWPRTEIENQEFKEYLKIMSIFYSNCQIGKIITEDYYKRAWCVFESIMSTTFMIEPPLIIDPIILKINGCKHKIHTILCLFFMTILMLFIIFLNIISLGFGLRQTKQHFYIYYYLFGSLFQDLDDMRVIWLKSVISTNSDDLNVIFDLI
jgi:hypothetical protein